MNARQHNSVEYNTLKFERVQANYNFLNDILDYNVLSLSDITIYIPIDPSGIRKLITAQLS